MLFKGSLITAASGKLGGVVASRNRGGQYFRQFAMPVNPATAFQTAVRNAMTVTVNRWVEELTAAERAAWDVYGSNVSRKNALGDDIFLSGQQWYNACNIPRLQAGLAIVDAAPTIFDRGEQDETLTIVPNATSQLIGVTFDDTQDWVDEDGSAMLIYASPPQNASKNFFAGPYRLAGAIEGSSTTPPTSPTTLAVPFPVVDGQALFTAEAITRSDGRLTSRNRFRSLVTT